MAGSGATGSVSDGTVAGQPPKRPGVHLVLRTSVFLLAFGTLVLAGLLTFAVIHELTTEHLPRSVPTQAPSLPPRPPLSRWLTIELHHRDAAEEHSRTCGCAARPLRPA